MKVLLRRWIVCGHGKTKATCRELLKLEPAMWTFVRLAGVSPTNNAFEKAIRRGVIFLVDVKRILRLTHGEDSDVDPAWSPDSRFLAFTSTRAGRQQVFVMDADSSAPHPLADLPGNSSTPSWSP